MNLLLRFILLYYALPSLVFFCGWYEPWVAFPLIVLIVWGIRRAETEVSASVPLKGRSLWFFLIGALLICTQQWMVGYTGHFPQHYDFHVRNAVFGSLCRESWPMASQEGCPFVYYAAAWLPSAALKKCIPWLDADWLFMVQNCVALVAAFYLLCCRLGRVSLLLIVGVFCLRDYPHAFKMISISDAFLGEEWVGNFYGAGIFPHWVNLMTQVQTSVNHAPYLMLAVSLVLLPLRRPASYILIGALLLPISPLGAIGLFPFLIWRLLQGGLRIKSLLRSVETWSGGLILIVCALYYMQSSAQATCAFVWQLPIFSEVYRRFFLILMLNVVLFGVIFIPFCFKRTEFWVAYGVFILLPFVYYGSNYNDLTFKASAVCLTVFAALLPELFARKGHGVSKILVVLMLINSIICSVRVTRRDCEFFGDKEHNVLDMYQRDYYGEKAIADRSGGSCYLLMRDTPPRILIPYVLKVPSTR